MTTPTHPKRRYTTRYAKHQAADAGNTVRLTKRLSEPEAMFRVAENYRRNMKAMRARIAARAAARLVEIEREHQERLARPVYNMYEPVVTKTFSWKTMVESAPLYTFTK